LSNVNPNATGRSAERNLQEEQDVFRPLQRKGGSQNHM
jgi:hypothetical protein